MSHNIQLIPILIKILKILNNYINSHLGNQLPWKHKTSYVLLKYNDIVELIAPASDS